MTSSRATGVPKGHSKNGLRTNTCGFLLDGNKRFIYVRHDTGGPCTMLPTKRRDSWPALRSRCPRLMVHMESLRMRSL